MTDVKSEILKATVATIDIGFREIEGLMFEDGSFGIAQQQVASLFSVLPKSVYKLLKRILGEGFQFFSVKTDRPKQAGKQNRPEKALTLSDFQNVVRALDKESNPVATQMIDELFGLSLHQLWSDAFDIKFEKKDRQQWLKDKQRLELENKTLKRELKTTTQHYNYFIQSTLLNVNNYADVKNWEQLRRWFRAFKPYIHSDGMCISKEHMDFVRSKYLNFTDKQLRETLKYDTSENIDVLKDILRKLRQALVELGGEQQDIDFMNQVVEWIK